jgi:hypothetical protein
MSLDLSLDQYGQMLRGVNPMRVGKDGKGFSHMEAYDIRAHLIRIFGFGGWSSEVTAMELVFETSTGAEKPRWSVAYRAQCRLTVQGVVYTEWAGGDAQNYPSRADAHDMAMKTAESQAFKRAAVNLGDQFGLSLYWKGSTAPLVRATLVGPHSLAETPEDVTEHITTPLAPENGESETPQRETSSPPAALPANSTAQVEAPAPSLAAAELPSTAASGEGGVGEEAAAVAAVASSFPGAAEDDGFEHCLEEIQRAMRTDPASGLAILKTAMEVATRRRLLARKVPETNVTLGARLTQLMGKATRAIESQEQEVAS